MRAIGGCLVLLMAVGTLGCNAAAPNAHTDVPAETAPAANATLPVPAASGTPSALPSSSGEGDGEKTTIASEPLVLGEIKREWSYQLTWRGPDGNRFDLLQAAKDLEAAGKRGEACAMLEHCGRRTCQFLLGACRERLGDHEGACSAFLNGINDGADTEDGQRLAARIHALCPSSTNVLH